MASKDLHQAALIETIANLWLDIDLYARTMRRNDPFAFEQYKNLIARIDTLADLAGTNYGAVFDEKQRLEDEREKAAE